MKKSNFTATRYGPRRPLRFAKKLAAWQLEAPRTTPLAQRLDMWRRGYRASAYKLYDLSPGASENYLPDSSRLDIAFINGPFARSVLNDKLLFTKLVGGVLEVPPVVALIERGEVYPVYAEGRTLTLKEIVCDHQSLILKPVGGTHGRGVHRLELKRQLSPELNSEPNSELDPSLHLDARPVTDAEVDDFSRTLDRYIVTPTVKQAAYARTICAETTNGVRVMTFVDPDTREPFVGYALHRFGTPATQPTDNWARGGLCCHVDLSDGSLGPGLKQPRWTGGKAVFSTHHPDSGAALGGVRIPRWLELCEGLLGAVEAFPFLLYVGWDVVVTDGGFVVLEGNTNSDLLQLGGGILKDPRVRRFYEYHGVI